MICERVKPMGRTFFLPSPHFFFFFLFFFSNTIVSGRFQERASFSPIPPATYLIWVSRSSNGFILGFGKKMLFGMRSHLLSSPFYLPIRGSKAGSSLPHLPPDYGTRLARLSQEGFSTSFLHRLASNRAYPRCYRRQWVSREK